jgi:hypothetical protein
MKRDDQFEKRLHRQAMREIPSTWREEILSVAEQAAASRHSSPVTRHSSWWRELFWPCPQAWAGLAAAWVLILALNAATREPVQVATAQSTPPAREVLMALKERRRLLAELAGSPEQVEPQKPAAPRPRSQLSQRTFTG